MLSSEVLRRANQMMTEKGVPLEGRRVYMSDELYEELQNEYEGLDIPSGAVCSSSGCVLPETEFDWDAEF